LVAEDRYRTPLSGKTFSRQPINQTILATTGSSTYRSLGLVSI
jgi:hypothetical protein